MHFELTSPAFLDGHLMPRLFTADGKNISPPLKWSGPPPNTQSYALLCEDPDAPRGTWTHWLAFNLPAETRELSESVPHVAQLPNGTRQGTNDFDKAGYGGPSPPQGPAHRYRFTLIALDKLLDLPAGVGKGQLLAAMTDHIVGECSLTGLYGRGLVSDIPDDPLEKNRLQELESIHTAPLAPVEHRGKHHGRHA
jgi:Raf kinase inhibitor-like YbhB/YbcL family protein